MRNKIISQIWELDRPAAVQAFAEVIILLILMNNEYYGLNEEGS